MRTTFAFTALLASWTAAVAAIPQPIGEGFIGQQSENCTDVERKDYVILCDKDQPMDVAMQKMIESIDALSEKNFVRFYNSSQISGVELEGICPSTAEALNAMEEVRLVDEKVQIQTYVAQKDGAPWGLQRISNEAGASGSPQGQAFTYTYEDEQLGANVDIYVVDTGVRTSHAVFTDRATPGFSFTDAPTDGDGHGTHVAGTAAGAKFGVAQGANIIAVKVLGDDGSGSSADTIAGMDWIINRHDERKGQEGFRGSIMSMSWGLQGTAESVDQVVLAAVEAGIHVSVAAGNDGADACLSTPAHNGGANSAVVSVGSINIENQVSEFSNIGQCVDIYAPGEQILSSWNTGDTTINFLSGTSMACPHVSGVMAYLLAENPELATNPADLKALLLETARKNAITGNTGGGDSLLLSNGVDGGIAAKRLMKNYVVPDAEKRTVTGSPASWARDFMNNLDKRWSVHSTDSPLRL